MDEQLKQRLLGATIIVTLVVIFVPMLFEDNDQPASHTTEIPAPPEAIEEHSIELPKTAADIAAQQQEAAPAEKDPKPKGKRPARETGYRVIPLNDPPPEKPAKPEKPTPAKAEASPPLDTLVEGEDPYEDEGAVVDGEGAPLEEAEDTPPPKTALAPAAKPVKPSKPESPKVPVAPALKPKLPAAPLGQEPIATVKPLVPPPQTTKPKVPPPVKPAVPVVVSKPPAVAKSNELPKVEVGVKHPAVVGIAEPTGFLPPPQAKPAPKPPADTAPKPTAPKTTTSEAPPSAWLVQAGSFAGENNARGLAERLRKQNIPAFVDVIAGSAGSVYRVRVGPELNRGRAEQIQKQIESAVGIKGIILPHR